VCSTPYEEFISRAIAQAVPVLLAVQCAATPTMDMQWHPGNFYSAAVFAAVLTAWGMGWVDRHVTMMNVL
jgi:hypothetical protein